MAITFAQALCQGRQIARQPVGTDPLRDALLHYGEVFKSKGISLATPDDRLLAVYTLLIGLGMRESSGRYCVGYDTTVKTQTSETAEGGLFQVSHDNTWRNPSYATLLAQYKGDPELCLLSVFKEGAKPCTQPEVGTGKGAEFQRLNKTCPAFAAEYAATGVRVNGGSKGEWGPLRRLEAEVNRDCYDMLVRVAKEATSCLN